MPRCEWCGDDPLYVAYHDQEWGVPCRDEAKLFEFLVLEGMQAGLSWLTILRKRDAMRRAFAGFDPVRLVRFGERERDALLRDASIIRNRLKIGAVLGNARALLDLHDAGASLVERVWEPMQGRPRQNAWRRMEDVPVTTPESRALSRRLKADGFRFVGPTICYAYMQAMGVVNDHVVDCPRHAACARLG